MKTEKSKNAGSFYKLIIIEKGVNVGEYTLKPTDIEKFSFRNTDLTKIDYKDFFRNMFIIKGETGKILEDKIVR